MAAVKSRAYIQNMQDSIVRLQPSDLNVVSSYIESVFSYLYQSKERATNEQTLRKKDRSVLLFVNDIVDSAQFNTAPNTRNLTGKTSSQICVKTLV